MRASVIGDNDGTLVSREQPFGYPRSGNQFASDQSSADGLTKSHIIGEQLTGKRRQNVMRLVT